jgi:dTDP-4-amino-4,6-dideoxygalactose transaminase
MDKIADQDRGVDTMNDMSKPAAVKMPIPFIDLQAQRRRIGRLVDEGMQRVLAHGQFILGPEVGDLERALSELCGAPHVIACANGTDALVLAMKAVGLVAGDAVIVPAFSFSASAEAVVLAGGTPVFCDVEAGSCNIDPRSLRAAVQAAKAAGYRPRAVMPVDLFGFPADYPAIEALAAEHGLTIIADAAQSFGAALGDRRVGTFGKFAATSFFPSKPLGCYGDGGAIFTADAEAAALLRSLRCHGEGLHRYDNVRVGLNSRLDSLQAAILLAKLSVFSEEIGLRQQVALRYNAALRDVVEVPQIDNATSSVWAQYTIKLDNRDGIAAALKQAGVPTAIYYPRPLHEQPAYAGHPVVAGGLPVAERLSRRVLSLPFHPYLDAVTQDYIIDQLRTALAAR